MMHTNDRILLSMAINNTENFFHTKGIQGAEYKEDLKEEVKRTYKAYKEIFSEIEKEDGPTSKEN